MNKLNNLKLGQYLVKAQQDQASGLERSARKNYKGALGEAQTVADDLAVIEGAQGAVQFYSRSSYETTAQVTIAAAKDVLERGPTPAEAQKLEKNLRDFASTLTFDPSHYTYHPIDAAELRHLANRAHNLYDMQAPPLD